MRPTAILLTLGLALAVATCANAANAADADAPAKSCTGAPQGPPASECGLEPGDVLVAIDGRPVAKLSEEEVRELLRDEDRDVALRISRGGSEINVSLRPRRLL